MKKKMLITLSAIFAFVMIASAHPTGHWEKLGERKVYFNSKKDIIRCQLNKTYTKLKIKVRNAPIDFDKIIVHYATGASQELKVRDIIEAGGESRVIDLHGNKRIIRDITFHYNSPARHKRHPHQHRKGATVSIWGRR